MHPLYPKANALSKRVIGAAIGVHRLKGPGLLESIYEKCLRRELEIQGFDAQHQVNVPVEYKGYTFEETLCLDLVVEGCLVLELKAVSDVLPSTRRNS